MKSLIAEKVKRNNDKIKADAQGSKKLIADQKIAIKKEQPKQAKSPEAQIAREAKTLMLDV